MIEKVRDFCTQNNIFGHLKQIHDPVDYYIYFISINDITRTLKMRATETERIVLAHMINFIMENGEIDGNKKSFDKLMDYIIKRGVLENKNQYLAHKHNLAEKNYIKRVSGKYHLHLDEKFKNAVKHDQINIFITRK